MRSDERSKVTFKDKSVTIFDLFYQIKEQAIVDKFYDLSSWNSIKSLLIQSSHKVGCVGRSGGYQYQHTHRVISLTPQLEPWQSSTYSIEQNIVYKIKKEYFFVNG